MLKSKNKILILGVSGMIGSCIFQYLSSKKNLSIFGTYNSNKPNFKNLIKFDMNNDDMFFMEDYDLIINCAGITKHNRLHNYNIGHIYNLNIKLPLILNDLKKRKKINIIHISTDCVFSGMNGNYRENSNDYSTDTYGQSKRIAESVMSDSLVIRTSTVGHEIFFKNGLLEWFLSNKSYCKGYQNAFFNGLTTLELSKIIYKYFIKRSFFPKLLINIGAYKISKYDLLCKLNRIYDMNIDIQKDVKFKIDRTLDVSKFLNLTDYKPKTWYRMLKENKNYIKHV